MEKQKTPQRLQSLDALRGFDMFFIMGGATLIAAIAAFWPNDFTQWLAAQMDHVKWDGLAHHDTIFPLFLFIAGISFPFSLNKQLENGKSIQDIYLKIIRRGLMLVFLGLVYNNLMKFEFDTLRFCSVLSRIGLGWMFGALIFTSVKSNRIRAAIIAGILLGYWLITILIPAPDANGADVFSKQGDFFI